MRFALCDDDQLFTSLIEEMLLEHGHEVVGVATTTADSVALVRAAHPDVVIVELALGFNTDFDIVDAATAAGASTIVFSRTHDEGIISQYPVRPTLVSKPDLGELERVVGLLDKDVLGQVTTTDRRTHPQREASGPTPTNLGDAETFYEALNAAEPGDVLLSVELPADPSLDATAAAEHVRGLLRTGDRILASTSAVRVYLPAADDLGAESFQARLRDAEVVPAGASVRVVVIAPGEAPADAFDRLRATPPRSS